MKKKLIGIVIVLLLMISFSGIGYAGPYKIGFRYVQHRVFENGKDINRLCVSLNYAEGGKVPDNVIDDVELLKEDSSQVQLEDKESIKNVYEKYPAFFSPNMSYGGFDWDFGEASYYMRDILEELIPDHWYTIIVTYHELGIPTTTYTDEKEYYYRGEVYLPVISSKSFKYKFDIDGLYFQWAVPKEMIFEVDHTLFDNFQSAPHIRAMIDRYDNSGRVWNLWVVLPYLMNGVFVPASSGIFDGEFDYIEVGVQVRTRDSSTRTYSNMKKIKIK